MAHEESYARIGGVPTKDEAYRLLEHHLKEASNQCLVIGHLFNTEDDARSKLLAKGWYGIGNELLPGIIRQIHHLMMLRTR